MAKITLQGHPIETIGALPAVGTSLAQLGSVLTKTDLADVTLKDFAGKKLVLNIFPSLDTSVCATSVRRFNKEVSELKNTLVLCISKDLPFAHARFCTTEGLENVISLSELRNSQFGEKLGLTIINGPMAGLLARAVIVLDADLNVLYQQLVPEIAQEPDYEAALMHVKA